MISSLGLASYYELRERTGGAHAAGPAATGGDLRFGYLDDELFQARYVVREAVNYARIVFAMPGIHCAACVWLLEKLPEVIREISRVRVDIVRGRATVWFDPRNSRLSSIARTFAGLGYVPRPLSAQSGTAMPVDRDLAMRLGVAGFSAMNVMLLFIGRYQGFFSGMEARYAELFAWVSLLLTLPAVLYSAQPFFKSSVVALRLRRLHIDVPISCAIIGGFVASAVNTVLGRDELYFDTVTALIFLLLVGRWFQQRALRRVDTASELLASLSPLFAIRLRDGDVREEVYVRSLQPGDRVLVPSGECFAADGLVDGDGGHIDNAIVTGESIPVSVAAGDEVWSGARNIGGDLVMRVSAVGERTRLGRILEDAAFATTRRGRSARFVDAVSRYFVWSVLGIAAITFGVLFPFGFWAAWDRMMAFLVVTCPCALGIATPIVLHLATARAAGRGILLKDGAALERLASSTQLLLDKTGTITTGDQSVVRVGLLTDSSAAHKVWGCVRSLEAGVRHPFGAALYREAEARGVEALPLDSQQVIHGAGVKGFLPNGTAVRIGAVRWLEDEGLERTDSVRNLEARYLEEGLSSVALGIGDDIVAVFGVGDTVRAEARWVIDELKAWGFDPALVSGDSVGIVDRYADSLGIQRRYGELTPENKALLVRRQASETIFVGDGINDAAALAAADIGIGISGGAEATLAVSDIFLLRPDLSLVLEAITGAKATVRLIRTHLGVSLVYNVTAGTLALLGYMSPLLAAVVMPLSSLSVIGVSVWRAPFRGESR